MTFLRSLSLVVLVSANTVLTGCFFLPSEQPVAYTPHAERIQDPMVVLREAAQWDCAKGADLELVSGGLEYTSPCHTNAWGTEVLRERIEVSKLSRIQIVRADSFHVQLFFDDGTERLSGPYMSFATEQEAVRVADALWALRKKQP